MATSLRPFDGQLDTPAPSTGLRPFDGTLDDEQPKAGVGGRLKDAGIALAKGVVGVPEAAVGLADIVTGGGVGKALENEGGTFGFRPKQAKDYLSSLQSDAYKAEQQQFSEAEGVGGKALAALQNPALVANTVVESAPSMLGGAALARGAGMAVPALAGRLGLTAAGEGAVMAGSQAEQIRQQTEDGLLTPAQAALAAGTGLVGGAAGALGSRAARALGVGDIDQMIASGAIKGSARQGLGIANRGARGALTEGVFEELPQSLAETGLQNIALDRPITQGMEESAVMGTLAGGVMGAGAGVVSGLGQKPPGVTEQEWQTILGAGDPDAIRPEVQPVEAPDLTTAPGAAEPRTGMDFTRDVDTSGLSLQDPAEIERARAQTMDFQRQDVTPEWETSQGAGVPREGLTMPPRQIDTSGLSLTPSEAMGIDPSAGPLSRAAASAVDSGATQAMQQAAAPQLEMNERPDGTLMVAGDFNTIRSQLTAAGIPAQSIIRNMRGATVGRTQAQAARQALSTQQEAANVSTPAPVQRTTDTGAGTGSAQPETGVPAGVGSSERGTGLAATNAELATGGDGGGRPVAAPAVAPAAVGRDSEWMAFASDTNTLGIPRAEMPQIKAEHRGAMVNFLKGRGVTSDQSEVDPRTLKPTQAEFSIKKVEKATGFDGPDRSILVSSDNHVVDGHHQWLAKLATGQPVKVIRLNAPIADLLPLVREFPSSTVDQATNVQNQPQGTSRAEAQAARGEAQQAAGGDAAATAGVPAAAGAGDGQADGVSDKRFPHVREMTDISSGPGGYIQPRPIAEGKPLYRETSTSGLDDMLSLDGRARVAQMFVADNPDLALGQGVNKGVRVTFRPDSLSGRENKKPGTGDMAGREYQTDIVAPRAVQSVTMPAASVKSLRMLTRRTLATDFDRKENVDGAVTFNRKGLPDLSKNHPKADTSAEPAKKTAKTEQVAKAPAEPVKPEPPAKKPVDRAASLRKAEWKKNPLRSFLGQHGLSMDLAKEFAPGITERRKAMVGGYGPIFRRSGKNLDLLAEIAREEGFISADQDATDLYELIAAVLRGERVAPMFAADAAQDEMQARMAAMQEDAAAGFDEFLAEQQTMGDPLASLVADDYTLSDIDGSGFADASPELKAEVAALSAQLETMGVDVEGIAERVAQQTQEKTANEYHEALKQALQSAYAETQATQPGSVRNSGEDGRSQAGASAGQDGLTAPTRKDIEAQQARTEQADKLDERAQVKRESELGDSTFMSGFDGDGRQDNTGNLFAMEPGPEYSQPYETDIFGEALPASNRAAAKAARSARVRRDVQPAAPVQGDTPAPAGDYNVRTVVGTEVKRKLGASRINNFADLAQATQYLYKSAVERFDAIVTDKDGKPLAVVGGFKGAVSQTSVYPGTIIGEAVRVPGAAKIWFSHNHPSGTAELSRADESLNKTLSDALAGSGIDPMGLIAVAGKKYAASNNTTGDIKAPDGSTEVPVIERDLIPPEDIGVAIDSPIMARHVAKSYYGKAGAPGIMLLDSQNRVAAWVPIPQNMRASLRYQGGLNAIYRAVSESNASAAVIAHGGELDSTPFGDSGKITSSQNIMAALRKIDVRPLDTINAETGQSQAEQGLAIDAGPLFDIADQQPTPTTYPPASQSHQKAATAFAERLSKNRDSFVLMDAVKPTGARAKESQSVSDLAKTMFGREVVFVQFKGRPLFNGAVSTTDPGKVFVNIESARPMMAVLGHELLHELRKSNPAAYNQLAKTLKNVTKDDYIYAALLKQKYSDQGLNWTPQDISEELYGDIVGDNFMDQKFWEALAGDKPIFAKQLYRAVMNWLDKIASMFKRVKVRPDGRMVMTLAEQADGSRPFGTQKYLQDIEAARAAVAQAMGQFKQGGKGKDALSVSGESGDALSIADAAGKGIDRIRQAANAAAGKNVPRAATMGDLDAEQKAFLNKTGSSKTPSTDTIKAATDRAGLKIRQGVIDRYAALKELDEKALGQDFIGNAITDSSWVLAKMSSAGSGALNAMMTTGRLEFDDKQKVIGIKGDANGGLTATLKKLGGPDEVERFFGWIAANRAEKLLGEGRENLFTPDEIKAAKRLNEGKTEEGKSRSLLYTQAFKEFQEYRDDVLAIAEKSGIISDETRALWRDEFYVPFYRVMQDDGKTGGPGGGKGLSRQEAFKKLKGGSENLNDLMENTLMNFHHLLSASLKNQAASQAIRNAEKVGIANPVPESRRDTDKSTFVLKNGQKVYYEIDDPLVFESITSLSDPGLNNFAVRTMSAFKRVFTNLTTVTPQFVIANTFRDLLQASATSPTSKNVALNAVQGLKTYRDQKTRAEMLASGGAFSFGHIYGMDPDEVKASLRKTVKGADLISDPSMIPGILRKGWKHWNDAIDTSENISRAATYAQNVEGLGKLRAAFEARDVMDFSQHGAWPAVRLLVRVVPFLNARLQGLDKLYRSGVKPSILTAMGKGTDTDKQAAARFATVAGALAVATMALYMANADDEEYQKLEEWQKDTYWFFRIGDNAFFLPKPFEVGAIATLAERTLQQFMDDKATGKLFGERVKEMLMQTFAFNPVPQMFQPIVDVYANRDAFTGRDIETMGMERLSPGLRARDTTTAVGRGLSAATRVFGDESAIAVSPVQADHLIKGYLGGVGASSAGILDTMYRAATGQESPDKRLSEYQPIRRFYRDLGAPAPNSRYSTLFYDGLREANRVYADVMELQKLGKTEEARELRTEKQNVLRMRQQLNAQQRRLSDINQRMQTVRRADKDGEWKRREIDMLNTQKALITERMGKMIEIVRAE